MSSNLGPTRYVGILYLRQDIKFVNADAFSPKYS